MLMKLIGAIFVITACWLVGAGIVRNKKKEEKMLRQFNEALGSMYSALEYQLTPLPELCRKFTGRYDNGVNRVLNTFAQELEDQICPDVSQCMEVSLSMNDDITDSVKKLFRLLGENLGNFDLEGQLNALQYVQSECNRILEIKTKNQEVRLRSYHTLAICAGVALAILLF